MFRLGLVAAAVLACAATSTIQDTAWVESVSPTFDETAVALDAIPTVEITFALGSDTVAYPRVQLVYADDGVQVPGQGIPDEVLNNNGEVIEVSFVPSDTLAPDTDYRLSLSIAGVEEFSWYSVVEGRYVYSYESEVMEVPFTTRSDPRIRSALYYHDLETYEISFTQEIDPNTLNVDNVYVLRNAEPITPESLEYIGGDTHQLELRLGVGFQQDSRLVLLSGIVAADGTPVAENLEGFPISSRR